MTEAIRKSGRVKWYNSQKGFGFLVVPGSIQDFFLHVSELRKAHIVGPIKDGEEMSFISDEGPRGLRATDVKRVAPHET